MGSKNVNISSVKILNLAYLSGDIELFNCLYAQLKKKSFYVSTEIGSLVRLLPDYESFGYRLDQPVIKSANGRISSVDVIHEGLHSLIADRFGYKLAGRPQMTLLNECFGLGLEIYNTAVNFKKFKLRSKQAKQSLAIWQQNSQLVNQSFESHFSEAINDPFQSYKISVVEYFKIHLSIFSYVEKVFKSKNLKLDILEKKLARFSRYVLIYHYNNAVPALYCAAHCGFRSSTADQKSVRTCLRLLETSKSMQEFLSKLSKNG